MNYILFTTDSKFKPLLTAMSVKSLNTINEIFCTSYVQNLFKRHSKYSKYWIADWCGGVPNIPVCPFIWNKLIASDPEFNDFSVLLNRLYKLYHLLVVVENSNEWKCM